MCHARSGKRFRKDPSRGKEQKPEEKLNQHRSVTGRQLDVVVTGGVWR